MMQDNNKWVEGGNIDPGKNRPDDDYPHVNHQDDMKDSGESA